MLLPLLAPVNQYIRFLLVFIWSQLQYIVQHLWRILHSVVHPEACSALCSKYGSSCNTLTGLCNNCTTGYSATPAGACIPLSMWNTIMFVTYVFTIVYFSIQPLVIWPCFSVEKCDEKCLSTSCNTVNGFCSKCASDYAVTNAGTCQPKRRLSFLCIFFVAFFLMEKSGLVSFFLGGGLFSNLRIYRPTLTPCLFVLPSHPY